MLRKYCYGLAIATLINIILYAAHLKLINYYAAHYDDNIHLQQQLQFLQTLQINYDTPTLRTVLSTRQPNDINLQPLSATAAPYFLTVQDIKQREGRLDISLTAATDCDIYHWIIRLSSLGYCPHYIALFYQDQGTTIAGKISFNKKSLS